MNSLKKQFTHGVLYNAAAKYSGIIIQLVVTAILARLLSPHEFGIIAICTVAIAFFQQFTDMGIGIAIVQRQDLSSIDYNHLFSFSIYFGILLSIVFIVASYPIAVFYDSSNLVIYMQLLSIQLLFSTFNMVPNALIVKQKNFRFLAIRQVSIQFVMGVFACLAAFHGCGVYSLLITPIFSSVFTFIVTFRANNLRFLPKFSLQPLRKIFSYSFYQLAFGIVNYFSRNLDKLLIGRYLNMSALGYYEKSYRLVLLPMLNITGVINPVVQPVLAELQSDRERLSHYLYKILSIINMICFPLSILAFFSSKEIIILFFGDQWYNAIPCFQILSLSIGMQAANNISGSFFQVANDTKTMFWIGTFNALENVLGFFISIYFFGSIEAVAWGVTIVFTLCFIQTYYVLFCKVLKSSFLKLIYQLFHPVLCSSILGLLLYVRGNLINCNFLFSLIINIIIFVLVVLIYYHSIGVNIKSILKNE